MFINVSNRLLQFPDLSRSPVNPIQTDKVDSVTTYDDMPSDLEDVTPGHFNVDLKVLEHRSHMTVLQSEYAPAGRLFRSVTIKVFRIKQATASTNIEELRDFSTQRD